MVHTGPGVHEAERVIERALAAWPEVREGAQALPESLAKPLDEIINNSSAALRRG